jgi:Uma2 family endonuclease
MTEPYEEILEGETRLRPPPGPRHEEICRRLHARVAEGVKGLSVAQLLPARSRIRISRDIELCPDLALVTAATGKLWLAAEVVSSEDHGADTVVKKGIYEQMKLPRLWMVDPRYDNVEVYHGEEHGLSLKEILAVKEVLKEPLLPGFQYVMEELFAI